MSLDDWETNSRSALLTNTKDCFILVMKGAFVIKTTFVCQHRRDVGRKRQCAETGIDETINFLQPSVKLVVYAM